MASSVLQVSKWYPLSSRDALQLQDSTHFEMVIGRPSLTRHAKRNSQGLSANPYEVGSACNHAPALFLERNEILLHFLQLELHQPSAGDLL